MLNKITVNIHSSVCIRSEKTLYIDPFRLSAAPHDADLILVTHSHYDHFSPEDIAKVTKEDTLFVFPVSMEKDVLAAGFDSSRVTFLAPGQSAVLLGVPVEAIPSYNTNKPMHPKANGWLGYLLTLEGKRIYICGDTDDIPEGRSVSCDIVMVPVGGTYTMNAPEAAAFVNALRPALAAIPFHYGSLTGTPADGETFKAHVDPAIPVCFKL